MDSNKWARWVKWVRWVSKWAKVCLLSRSRIINKQPFQTDHRKDNLQVLAQVRKSCATLSAQVAPEFRVVAAFPGQVVEVAAKLATRKTNKLVASKAREVNEEEGVVTVEAEVEATRDRAKVVRVALVLAGGE